MSAQEPTELTADLKDLVAQTIQARVNRDAYDAEYKELLSLCMHAFHSGAMPASFEQGGYKFLMVKGRTTTKYQYSEAVREAEEELVVLKELEVESGKAEKTVTTGEPHWSLKKASE